MRNISGNTPSPTARQAARCRRLCRGAQACRNWPRSSGSTAIAWSMRLSVLTASRGPASMKTSIAARTSGNLLLRKRRGANASLGTIEKPPFYGVELHPTGAASVGLRVNGSGQVIHQRRHPIPGLYASGNVAAATEHGVGYQAGLSLAAAMTFSYLAVRHMIEAPQCGLG